MQQLFPSKLCKLLVLILTLLLIVGVAACSGNQEISGETLLCTVSSDNLEVHKKSSFSSRVLGQLPLDLELEILEQITNEETTWGRIDTVRLPDGKKIKGGWINLQHVKFPGEDDAEATEPKVEIQIDTPTITATMGTVTAGKLNVRKGPDSKYETAGAYYKGDRIEILETQTADDTLWGRTNLGWIGMGYVRMDGSPVSNEGSAAKVMSNGNTTVLGYGVVNLGELNVRSGPDTDYDKVGTVKQGVRYAYYQVSSANDNWVRIEDGWVSTEYFYIEGTSIDTFTGTVTTDDLNVRTGPDTSFQSVGKHQKGDTVEVLAQVGSWGYTEQGWVFLSYVQRNAPTYSTGTCRATRGLNIRQEPNADSEIVATLVEGNVVTVLEVQGGWGRTVQGWINLKYVEYDSVG